MSTVTAVKGTPFSFASGAPSPKHRVLNIAATTRIAMQRAEPPPGNPSLCGHTILDRLGLTVSGRTPRPERPRPSPPDESIHPSFHVFLDNAFDRAPPVQPGKRHLDVSFFAFARLNMAEIRIGVQAGNVQVRQDALTHRGIQDHRARSGSMTRAAARTLTPSTPRPGILATS